MTTILFNGHDLKFLSHIIEYYNNQSNINVLIDNTGGHRIVNERNSKHLMNDADLIFCEWALGNAEWYSKNKKSNQKLVIRLHHQEINLKYLKNINYSNVDKIIFICPENLEIFCKRFPSLKPLTTLIFNVIDCKELDEIKLTGSEFNLGFIGTAPKRKAPHHAFNILKRLLEYDKRYTLCVKGKKPWEFAWLVERKDELEYFDKLFLDISLSKYPNAVIFDPHGNDMPSWFSKIGFILSTSDHEGSHQAVAEGMASGAIPIIRNWAGAEKLYPSKFIVSTEEEAVSFIRKMHDPSEYYAAVRLVKQFARENFDIPVITAKYDDLFASILKDQKKFTSQPLQKLNAIHNQLRVLHICFLKPGNQSGYEVRVLEESKVLVQLGVEVHVAVFINKNNTPDQTSLDTFKIKLQNFTGGFIHIIPTTLFFNLEKSDEQEKEIDNPVRSIIEQNQISIIHGQALYAALHAIRIANRTGLKAVFDVHGVLPEENRMNGATENRVKQLEHYEKKALEEINMRIFVSKRMREYYEKKYNKLFEPFYIIPCCVHQEDFQMQKNKRESFRSKKGFNNKFVFVYLGTLSIWQWPDAIFNMFSRFYKSMPSSILYLLIPQYDHNIATLHLQKYNLPTESYLMEEVPHYQIGEVLAAADAGILLRENHPVNFVSSPTKFGEYLAAGLPVVLTENIGDYSELVEESDVGLKIKISHDQFSDAELFRLVEFTKKVQTERETWSIRCMNLAASKLNWPIHGKELIKRYKSMMDTSMSVANKSEGNTTQIENKNVKVVLGGILDTFTYDCFSYEFEIIRPDTVNWKTMFESQPVHGLFVESAWYGNQNTWKNMVGNYSKTNAENLVKVVEWCKLNKIPTIFWNKEDPVHFNYFINHAKLFDYIFTTDQNIVPEYLERINHKNVYSLPFASQPAIHNPYSKNARDKSVCFAGTYYTKKYLDRQQDMDILLRPSLDYGLEIYDRNFGIERSDAANYQFPDLYQPFIRGRLEYNEMIEAYKRYKVFLNVNSVKESPTMFSRRVFELLACGTPVISTYSEGIQKILGNDTVLFTDSEETTRQHLEHLINDDHYWWKISLRGMRKVMNEHTYNHRANYIFSKIGIEFSKKSKPKFLILINISNFEDAHYLLNILTRQTYQNLSILINISNNSIISDLHYSILRNIFSKYNIYICSSIENINLLDPCNKYNCDYICIINSNHYYGSNYLMDFSQAIVYQEADAYSKNSYFYLNSNKIIGRVTKSVPYKFSNYFNINTLVINSKYHYLINSYLKSPSDAFINASIRILSIDPYNYLENGRKIHSDKNVINMVDI